MTTAKSVNKTQVIEQDIVHCGYVLILMPKNSSSNLESEESGVKKNAIDSIDKNNLFSMPLIIEQEELEADGFSFDEYFDNESYDLVFVHSYDSLKQHLVGLRKLAKEHLIEIDKKA